MYIFVCSLYYLFCLVNKKAVLLPTDFCRSLDHRMELLLTDFSSLDLERELPQLRGFI